MDIKFEEPRGGAPLIWLRAGNILIERMDEVSAKHPEYKPLQVASVLRRKYPDDYQNLAAKSLVNRYGEAKQRSGMRLSASLAECRAALVQQLRQQRRVRRKRERMQDWWNPQPKRPRC
jgi:hypothetical protein